MTEVSERLKTEVEARFRNEGRERKENFRELTKLKNDVRKLGGGCGLCSAASTGVGFVRVLQRGRPFWTKTAEVWLWRNV